MQREDIEEIYNAGDSGREGEYIQRLVFTRHEEFAEYSFRLWSEGS